MSKMKKMVALLAVVALAQTAVLSLVHADDDYGYRQGSRYRQGDSYRDGDRYRQRRSGDRDDDRSGTRPTTTPAPTPGPSKVTPPHGNRGACNQCHGSKYGTDGTIGSPAPTTAPTPTPAPTVDGAALYSQYCAGCHGSSMRGKSASSIQNAINSNKGGMGSLKSLTSAQINAISQY
jgi:cytochrome c553